MRTIKAVMIFFVIVMVSAAFGNKLVNGDFELGTVASVWGDPADVSYWTQTGGTHVDNKAHLSDGTWGDEAAVSSLVTPFDKAVKWRWGNKGIYQEFTAAPGEETTFSVEVLNHPDLAVTGRQLQIRVSWYDGSGGIISSNTVVDYFDPTVHTATGVWHLIEGSMVAPATAATGRMELWSQTKPEESNIGVFYADNAVVLDSTVTEDTDAPTPDPMTFEIAPQAVGATAVTMTATEAADPSGVQYLFTCTSGGGHDSDWQVSRTYMDTGLAPETTYTYTVKARDLSSNQDTNVTAPSSPPAPVTTGSPHASLENGGFEDGATGQFGSVTIPGWSTWGTNGWHHSESGHTQDAKAAKLTESDSGVAQEVAAIGSYNYEVSAKIASFSDNPAVNRDGGVYVEWYDGSGLLKKEKVGFLIGNLDERDVWKTVSAILSSPQDASLMKVFVFLEDFTAGGTPSGTCHFDNITLTPIGEALCAEGDLDENCQVDLDDVAVLSQGWGDIFHLEDLAAVGAHWLECTMYDQAACFAP